MTTGPEVRFRTITRTRFLALPEPQREEAIRDLYRDNLDRVYGALAFCHANQIPLYRATSALFPQIDDPLAKKVLAEFAGKMAGFGPRAERLGIRVVLHPDQFVVLNSASADVAARSAGIMDDHAHIFDLLGLPRSTWSAMILHGGKGGRADELVATIRTLPDAVRDRLVLENDEYTYGADAILNICRAAGVPMVFDAHHHAVKEKLDTYEHESVARYVALARDTWPQPQWQIVHLSNGSASFGDPRHSDLITTFPSAFRNVPWVEVEAKGKENAIAQLRTVLAGE